MAYNPKNKKKKKQLVSVKYTSRDFNSIKQSLVEHAKRYYPDTFADFNEASFGSMMLDTAAYVGDVLSFYLDYQANESFLDTSAEKANILRHAKRMGYDPFITDSSSSGVVSVYITMPALVTGGGPDPDYFPILKTGATFVSKSGVQYTLTEDIDFGLATNEVVVAEVDDSGTPTLYAIKAFGSIISGATFAASLSIGEYTPFLKVSLTDPNIIEILSVRDTTGREYFQVDYLSQDVVYRSVENSDYDASDAGEVKHLLKPFAVPYRFTTERDGAKMILQFGAGSETEIGNSGLDPSNVVLSQYGKSYTSDESFDPSRLLKTGKLGISPSNTTLQIVYRANNKNGTTDSQTDTITSLATGDWSWKDLSKLTTTTMSTIISSVECTNSAPIIGDSMVASGGEIKMRAKAVYASQNRAVTREDYVAQIYAMPSKFGSVKRCSVVRDDKSMKRNLNVYVVNTDNANRLVTTPGSIKQNIKVWLAPRKMINDSIDILNARRVSLGIEFTVLSSKDVNKYDVHSTCVDTLKLFFARHKPDIGDPFRITDVYKILNAVPGVVDAIDVDIIQKYGTDYGDIKFDIYSQTTPDKRLVTVPQDTIWEVRYPETDISGVVK